ncbi:MAG: FMN-binding protein [Clostridia bacterium]|nr:FMN-binding protein [Clostridia bacterium]
MRKSLGYEIFMTALVLVVIAGVAGALLGFVNSVTYVDESKLLTEKAEAFFGGKLDPYSSPEGFMAETTYDHGDVIDVFQSQKGGESYVLIVEGEGAYKGTLRLLVCITNGRIEKIAKYEANETPGLGSKALEESYFKQYCGKVITPDFKGFALVKGETHAPDEVSAVSGASKSSTAVTNAVNAAVKWYQSRIKGVAR